MNQLLVKTIAGSRLHGTFTEDSDYDFRMVSFEPIEDLLGLGRSKPKHTIKDGDDFIDYPLSKFVDMCLSANPSVLEILFTPEKYWIDYSRAWIRLHGYRRYFISTKVRDTFGGFSRQELKHLKNYTADLDSKRYKLIEQYGYDTKSACNIYRLITQAFEILEFGDYNPVLSRAQRDFALDIREGKYQLETLVYKFEEDLKALDQYESELPFYPDRTEVQEMLIDIYMDYLEDPINARKI